MKNDIITKWKSAFTKEDSASNFDAYQSLGDGDKMSAYLYTWNPNLWPWRDQQDAIDRIKNGEHYDMRWSCGRTKRIEIGDMFFGSSGFSVGKK
jgi:hypothetical protein